MKHLWQSAPSRRRVRPLDVEQLEDRCVPSVSLSRGPDVTYHGGPLLQNVQIQNVYYGRPWSTDATLQQTISQTDGFLQYFVTSPYFATLQQYNVGNGTLLTPDDVVNQNPPSGTTLDDSQIRQVLDSEITANHLTTPGSNSLYIFYTAPGVEVTADGENSDNNFSGYHDVFTDTAGATVYYAVIPYPAATAQLTTFQQETLVLSHEIAESVTDPDTQSGWLDPRNGEIADIANGQYGMLNGYVVSAIWSQADGQVVVPSAASSTTTAAALQVSGVQVKAVAGQSFTSVVATITGVPSDATAASYTATIDWGNGTTSAGTVTADPNGGFDVTGTNICSQTGSFAITVTVDDSTGTVVGTGLSAATVTAASPTVTATGTLLTATAGQPFTGTVATFTDSSSSAALGNYTATIHWGDGTTSTGTIAAGTGGGFVVSGTHTYAGANQSDSEFSFGGFGIFEPPLGSSGPQYFVVTVTITDTPTNTAATALSLATVTTPPPVITAKSDNIAAVSGQPFSGEVASFTDTNTSAAASDFTATITWGDGTTSSGTVTASNGGFVVSGTHTYTLSNGWFGFFDFFHHSSQNFIVGVSITDTMTQDQATTTGLATVSRVAPNLTVVAQNITAVSGQPFSGEVATFTDVNTSQMASDFTATINWGDGTTSTGTITAGSNGTFLVSGSHTYTDNSTPISIFGGPRFDFGEGGLPFLPEGSNFPFSVTVQSNTNSDFGSAQGSVTVTPAPADVQVSGTLIDAVCGQSFSGTVATFTSSTPVAGLTATINWGDGTTSTGTITAGSNGTFVVNGTHTYGTSSGEEFPLLRFPFHGVSGPQAFLVSVTFENPADNSTATGVSLASVTTTPPSLSATGVNLDLSAGNAYSGTVATFTDTDGDPASNYTATIVWGDGTHSKGTITANPNGGFLVGGSHTYAFGGTFTVFVRIRDTDGDSAVSLGTATVGDNTPISLLPPVALGFLTSVEYYTDLILKDYQQFLARTASSAEIAYWVNLMQQGATDTQVLTGFLSSTEFFGRAGNNGKAWVDALYQDLLGRSADSGGESYWLQQLADGASLSDLALGFATSQEYEGDRVHNYYQQYLGRGAAASEVAYWVNSFENGMTNDQIVASFVGSQEYFQNQHANVSDWLTSAYQNLLSRKPDPTGFNSWLAALGK